MAITIRSIIDNMKRELNDTAGDMWSESDTQAERYVVGNFIGTEQTFVFTKIATGYYTCNVGTDALFFSSATPFSGAATDYDIDAGTDELNPFIKVTSGTETASSLTVTATRVNYRNAMADVFWWRAGIAAQEDDSINLDGSTTSAGTKTMRLKDAARRKTGAVGV